MAEPKEPTEKQILEFLNNEISYLEKRLDSSEMMGWSDKVAVIKPDLLMFQAIRRLIQGRPKVSKEFLQRWEDNFAYDIGELGSPKFIGPSKEGLAKMLTELGHEAEDEEGKG